jgi:hypothetical protein
MEGWQFILAGGGLYNNLDYSFVATHEDGTFIYPAKQPGGGNPDFRKQMKILKDFIHQFDFVRTKPDNSIIKGGLPEKAKAYALVEPGKQYAIYIFGGSRADLALDLPAGNYRVEWLNPLSGNVDKKERLKHSGGTANVLSPDYKQDIAVSIVKK